MTLNNEDAKLNSSIRSEKDYHYNNNENLHDLNICHYCLSLIPSTTVKCPHCGEWISDYYNKEDTNLCSSCREKIPLAAIKCMHCGSWVNSKLEKNMNDLEEEEINNEVNDLIEYLKHDL